ncbi:MAG: cell wall-active antibiotics response protein, partial [Treponema sp.]|nr:cell wall-active antibiotics response protein [Treponema sp.]
LVGVAAAILINCVARLSFTIILIPLAILYYVFWDALGLGAQRIPLWTLILAVGLGTAGLSALFPRRHFRKWKNPPISRLSSGTESNPILQANFGGARYRLSPGVIEGAHVECNFASMRISLEDVELKDGAATVFINCAFGGIKIIAPRHWRVDNEISCALGGVETGEGPEAEEGAPRLTLTGSVSFGGVEVKRR